MTSPAQPSRAFSTTFGVNETEQLELQKYFNVDEDETLKMTLTCTLKHGVSGASGKMYITNRHICFHAKGMFHETSKMWDYHDILDVSKSDKGVTIYTLVGKKYSFYNFDQADKAMSHIQRVLYGNLGNSAIHVAVEQKDGPRVKLLLDQDATRLNSFNKSEQAPLHLAFLTNDQDMVKLLLEYYAANPSTCDINIQQGKSKNTFLHAACKSEKISDDILLDLINFPGTNVEVKNADNTTPLHYFCESNASVEGCKKIGTALIERSSSTKAYVSAANSFKETPIHKAVFNKYVRNFMVELLIKFDAELDVRNDKSETPLHYAVRLGREDLTRMLVEAGADSSLKTKAGQTPLALAQEYARSGAPEATNIEKLLSQIDEMKDILTRAGISDMTSRFIREGLYEPDQLSSLNEKMLEKMKIEIKVGPQIKLLKEIESFKKKVEERKAEEDRKRAEEKKNRQRPPDEDEDETVRHDADKVREELGIVDGKWEIDTTELEYTKLLGSGASGKVYKGLFKGKEVAIKVLTNIDVEETLDEFKKEFQIMTTVRSPYMVHFYGAGLNKKLCMVLEYCQRGSLYHVMNEKQFTWSWDTTFRFALDMAHGMDVLHNWNPAIVHRDLKSLNLLVTTDMRVKVCDFGLSRSTAGNLETFKKLCGTFAYCAPEIFNGGTFTNRSDVFSMGIVIWELLIRSLKGKYEQPYSEYKNLTYDFQIMVQAAGGLRPTLPEGTPASFLQLYKDCTDAEVSKRPTATDVIDRLREIRKEYRANKDKWDAICKP